MNRLAAHCASRLLAVLALVSQLALGAMVLPDQAAASQAATLDALSVICHAGGASSQQRPAPKPAHRGHAEAALCPLSVTLALPSIVASPDVMPPPRAASVTWRWSRPISARGPPSRAHSIGYPRGPPVLA